MRNPREHDRYVVQRSSLKEGYWVVTDIKYYFVVIFKEHAYEDQHITDLNDPQLTNKIIINKVMRDMKRWMEHHYFDIV